jgi:hypothetical protein
MELNARDDEIINLLTKLKNVNETYPQELLTLRRQGYIKQIADVSAGAGLALALRSTLKGGNGVGGAPVASKLLEVLLVVAIVAEASTVAYFYRDRLAELFRTSSSGPGVEEISVPPVIESPFPTSQWTISPVATETTTKTETPIATPSFEFAAEATNQGGGVAVGATDQAGGVAVEATHQGSTEEGSQTVSTPAPSDNTNDHSDNGNHYGLTPKPERTKEPAGNNNSPQD